MSDPIREDLLFTGLRDEIEISSFQCESEELNNFLHNTAKFNEKNLLSKIYLYYNKTTKKVIGFITLSNYLLRLADSKTFGIQKVPAALIGGFALQSPSI